MNKGTNRKLIVAYSKLIKKESGRISVTDLCEKAGVARATFYLYYSDMESFQKKLSGYIIEKFFSQAVRILTCSDDEMHSVVKKENLIFDEYETDILGYMIQGTNYIDFASFADSYYVDKNNDPLFTLEMWEKHKEKIDIFSRGYLPILILGITNYEEMSFRKDMKYCRMFFRTLYEHIKSE